MEHRFEKEYGCLILKMPRELDHHQAEILKEEADELLLKYPVRSLVFDFEDTCFMDSSGIAVVLRAKRRMEALAGTLVVVNIPRQASRVLETAGLGRYVDLI